MKIQTLVKDYSKLSDANLDLKAQGIIVALNGNTNFPTTVPSLADFTLVKDAYTTSLQNAQAGGKMPVAIKNQAREDLLTSMKLLGFNLESQSQGDRLKLISTGYELTGDGDNVPPMPAPTNFMISDGMNQGEVKFSIKGVPQAVSYIHQYTLEPLTPDSRWIMKATTLREHTFTGISSGSRIFGRVAAIGHKGQEVYTSVLSRVVQ